MRDVIGRGRKSIHLPLVAATTRITRKKLSPNDVNFYNQIGRSVGRSAVVSLDRVYVCHRVTSLYYKRTQYPLQMAFDWRKRSVTNAEWQESKLKYSLIYSQCTKGNYFVRHRYGLLSQYYIVVAWPMATERQQRAINIFIRLLWIEFRQMLRRWSCFIFNNIQIHIAGIIFAGQHGH